MAFRSYSVFRQWGYHHPFIALMVLIIFGSLDWALFHTCKDVTVCYRCLAQFRNMTPNPAHNSFDLGVGERYRQERLRREEFG